MTTQLSVPQRPLKGIIPHSHAERLCKCYDMAQPAFLYDMHEEVAVVLKRLLPSDVTLVAGCGYGRILPELARSAKFVMGIDPVRDNIRYGREWLKKIHNCLLLEMNADTMSYADCFFNKVICIQNSLSVFKSDPVRIIREFLRVARKNGEIILSVYSGNYWDDHLAWHEIKSRNGLIAEIDYARTKPGRLVCKDGNAFNMLTPEFVSEMANLLKTDLIIEKVNERCSFHILRKT